MIATPADWLAPEVAALTELFGPFLDVPENITLQAMPDRHIGIWRIHAWRLLLTAERLEQRHRQGPATVRREVVVSVDPIRGGYRANVDTRHATVREIVDDLAAWAAGGINTLDFGAVS